MTRLGRLTSAFLLIALLTLVAFVGAVLNIVSAQSQSTCSTTFVDGLNLDSVSSGTSPQRQVQLFTMQPNSVAVVCVSYRINPSSLNVLQPSENTVNFSAFVYSVQATSTDSGKNTGTAIGYYYSFTPAAGVTTSASPSSMSFNMESSSGTLAVTYTITSSDNSNGDYALAFTNLCSNSMIPLAITGNGQSVTSSDFSSGFFFSNPASSCVVELPLSSGEIIGIGGITTSWMEVGN